MKNTLQTASPILSKTPAEKRFHIILAIVANEMTEAQQDTFLAYYLGGKTIQQIADERKVNKSTVSRNLQRAEERLLRFTRHLDMVQA
ncbi:MAG: sigma-70 region 4 domain-containing protein [Clostridia bacterium]|nr:sigma-70 region 4 domain-containing protein [Clostridia bacterium]